MCATERELHRDILEERDQEQKIPLELCSVGVKAREGEAEEAWKRK